MPEHSGDALVTEKDREGPQVSPGSGLTTRKEQKGPRRTTEMSVFRPPSGQGPRTSRIVDIGAKPEQSKLEQQMAEICLDRMTRKSYPPPAAACFTLWKEPVGSALGTMEVIKAEATEHVA